MSIDKILTTEQMRERAALQFQDMEAQYAHFLKDNANNSLSFKSYVAKVYCAENSPHPARFARWYHSHYGAAK